MLQLNSKTYLCEKRSSSPSILKDLALDYGVVTYENISLWQWDIQNHKT